MALKCLMKWRSSVWWNGAQVFGAMAPKYSEKWRSSILKNGAQVFDEMALKCLMKWRSSVWWNGAQVLLNKWRYNWSGAQVLLNKWRYNWSGAQVLLNKWRSSAINDVISGAQVPLSLLIGLSHRPATLIQDYHIGLQPSSLVYLMSSALILVSMISDLKPFGCVHFDCYFLFWAQKKLSQQTGQLSIIHQVI